MTASDYIGYFDESGDHGLQNIDSGFPVFVLCGWVFRIRDYLKKELPAFSAIKFKHFGHDAVVFHSRNIRKRIGPFQILANTAVRASFMADLETYYANCSGTLIAAAIDKKRHVQQYRHPINPYSISLLFCLERTFAFLRDQGETGKTMFCVFEERGAAEDQDLTLRFERICAGDNQWGALPFRMMFASKKTNMPGLQIADLAAYPIGRHVMAPARRNRSFDVLKPNFRRSPGGVIRGWGLKVFP